ncbi:pimeloyl-ACP methyl ester carboxylesterase [Nocardia tenerifensis]|uniref:Pimeloyl-ACP methyl ester carboxylesterase n=1 Tax=Nocardia tenerifensis TaxID=228006 RepID=A0A318JU17_9NOCA|nr:alpha/beta hydrolase [Nocardia tenerifensis]PXX60234.1 pimeloyl-ACP methyl ester carboxylesterase [Nocardia tenerifensis]
MSLSSNDLRDDLYVYQDGPRDAPALLLIHGTAASSRSWEPMLPLLTGSHRVIRVDLLGCGRSAGLGDTSYTVADQARRVGAAMDRVGVEHVVVVGHSSGGAVATALAELRPELVAAVVIIDFGPDMGAYIGQDSSAGPPVDWSKLTDDQFRQMMRSGFSPDYQIPQEYVDQFRAIDPLVFAAASQANSAYLEERSLPERLAPLGKPLLVIFGEDDSRWRPSAAVEYHAVPGATVVMLPGVGHSPNLEDPARTAEPLLAFAAKHEA